MKKIEIVVYEGINEAVRRVKEIFNDPDKATIWLKSPNYALGGQIPIRLIEKEEDIALILDELGRIEHGVFI
jgi:putative toxin-antitoxin system antitoxin component (TIGR02293 family)